MSEVTTPPVQETPKADASETLLTNPPAKAEGTPEAKVEAKPQETKTTEAPKPAVPEKYELKLMENSRLTQADVEKVSLFAKEKGLTQEQAQSVLDREQSTVDQVWKGQAESLKAKSQEWIGNIKSDKELGGDGYVKNVELAKRVVTKFGTEDFRKTLEDTGLGNHPELLRVFARIGKAFSEDQLIIPGSQSPASKRDAATTLYHTHNKQEK